MNGGVWERLCHVLVLLPSPAGSVALLEPASPTDGSLRASPDDAYGRDGILS